MSGAASELDHCCRLLLCGAGAPMRSARDLIEVALVVDGGRFVGFAAMIVHRGGGYACDSGPWLKDTTSLHDRMARERCLRLGACRARNCTLEATTGECSAHRRSDFRTVRLNRGRRRLIVLLGRLPGEWNR